MKINSRSLQVGGKQKIESFYMATLTAGIKAGPRVGYQLGA